MAGLMDNYCFLARYNGWFNTRLYDACERLDDAGRHAPRGAFFGSIHGTLNHILWGDMVWLGRLAAVPDDFAQRTMRYRNTQGVAREHPVWQALTHLFNHQTHHRGQVTTLLAQAGVDVGVTDLIALV